MRKKIYGIIWEEQLQRGVAAEISQALMEEVYTTPKPGLVDRKDTGAHTDMNCQTFQKSTEAIAEDLAAMFEAGYSWEADPKTLFPLLRERGKKTEDKKRVGTGSEKIKTKLGDHAWRKNLLPSGRERSPGTGDERISDSV